MTGARRPAPDRAAVRLALPALLVLAAATLLVGGPGTFGWWSDQATVTGATITSGSLDLVAGGAADDEHTWSELSLDDVAPGESVAAELVVRNAGSVPFTLTVDGSATGDLAPEVTTKVTLGAAASVDSAVYPRTASCSGSPDYSGTLGSTPAEIVTAGEVLQAGETTTICAVLKLTASAPNSAQGDAVTPTLDLTADQEVP